MMRITPELDKIWAKIKIWPFSDLRVEKKGVYFNACRFRYMWVHQFEFLDEIREGWCISVHPGAYQCISDRHVVLRKFAGPIWNDINEI